MEKDLTVSLWVPYRRARELKIRKSVRVSEVGDEQKPPGRTRRYACREVRTQISKVGEALSGAYKHD